MIIDDQTLAILKNFSAINPSIVFNPGNQISIAENGGAIYAIATVDQEIPTRFAIADLNRFIQTLNIFDYADIEPSETTIKIKGSNGEQTNYTCANASIIKEVPKKGLKLPTVDILIDFKLEFLTKLMRAAGALKLPMVSIYGDGTNIKLRLLNPGNPTSDVFSLVVGETDKSFDMWIKVDNMKIIPTDYTLSICCHPTQPIAEFKADGLVYWVAMEMGSRYDK